MSLRENIDKARAALAPDERQAGLREDPLVTAIETALSDTVAWRKPAYLSDTVQSLVAAGEYRQAAEVMAPRIRSLVDVAERLDFDSRAEHAATPSAQDEETPEPAIDPIHWATAVDTSGMRRVGLDQDEENDHD